MDEEESDCTTEDEGEGEELPQPGMLEATSSSRFEWFQLVKFLTVLVTFVLSTAAAVVSTGSTIFLVSQIRYPEYEQPPRPTCGSTECEKYESISRNEDAAEAWMWVLLWALLFPEALTFLRSLFTIIGMQQNPLSTKNLFSYHLWIPLLFQTIHIIGVLILFYVALPHLSSVKMLIVITSVSLFPSFLKCCTFKTSTTLAIIASILNLVCLLIQVVSIAMWTIFPGHQKEVWSLPLGLFLTSFGWWKAYLPNEDVTFLKGMFKKLRRIRDTKRKERKLIGNMFVSLWTMILSFSFLLIVTHILKPVPEVGDLFKDVKWGYKTNVESTLIPGPPPSINLNETYQMCSKFPNQRAISIPYFAHPDESDCSAFWTRGCNLFGILNVMDTLSYNLCPDGKSFYSNETVKVTCREVTGDEDQAICCKPTEEVDCSNRGDFVGCSNGPELSSFSFPNDTESFQDPEDNRTTSWSIPWSFESGTFYPPLALLVQVISTILVYQISKFACQGRIEVVGFALPMTLAPIVTIATLVILCFNYSTDACFYSSVFPNQLFFTCHEITNSSSLSSYISEIVTENGNWIFILSFLSQIWIAVHIWTVQSTKLARAEQIFSGSYYTSFLVIPSLLMSRKREKMPKVLGNLFAKKKPKVIGCATMWHENAKEMNILIKSILQMDKNSKERTDEDQYDWETHIFFDDAITKNKISGSTKVNEYVKELLGVMGKIRNVSSPTKIETPYGGRFEWELPHKTKLVCHLKDKSKIRHKKRWSQCMYFLYFLKFQEHTDIKNTFLLALDGDMSFTFDAVTTLLDVLKRNERLGAACGRMHPTGSGFIAWYQKWEYAIGHWMQKATEDILGNVLCSPGCFSMFRGQALLQTYSYTGHQSLHKPRKSVRQNEQDKPAMEEYMTVSTEPKHYIQYDQGEDRWLCTLLIKRGWRIKYCAISNSETACPETFDEFYNQRRRWTPSTVANLVDILRDSKFLLKHGYLNIFHVFYQILTLFSSAIGPGSIIIMMVGGLPLLVESMSLWTSLALNLGLVFTYTLICVLFSSKTQITAAKVFSLIYSLMMIIIMIGVLINAYIDPCIWAPATVTLELTCGAFVFVGLMHPLELKNLLYFIVYFLTIPCMYLFLPFFCVFNIDDVSWGTREANKSPAERPQDLSEKISNVFTAKKEIESLQKELKDMKDAFIKANPPKENIDNPLPTDEIDGEKHQFTRWINDPELPQSLTRPLDRKEETFWKNKIKKHLKPMITSKEKEKEIKAGLQALRTEVFVQFFFVNMAWVLLVFFLELTAASSEDYSFTMHWPLCVRAMEVDHQYYSLNSTMLPPLDTQHKYTRITPINVVFLALFVVVLFIQLIGMIIHRIETVRHITTNTFIFCSGKTSKFIKKSLKRKNNGEENDNMVVQSQATFTQRQDTERTGIGMEMQRAGNEYEEVDTVTSLRQQPRHAYTNKGFKDGNKKHVSMKLSGRDTMV